MKWQKTRRCVNLMYLRCVKLSKITVINGIHLGSHQLLPNHLNYSYSKWWPVGQYWVNLQKRNIKCLCNTVLFVYKIKKKNVLYSLYIVSSINYYKILLVPGIFFGGGGIKNCQYVASWEALVLTWSNPCHNRKRRLNNGNRHTLQQLVTLKNSGKSVAHVYRHHKPFDWLTS